MAPLQKHMIGKTNKRESTVKKRFYLVIKYPKNHVLISMEGTLMTRLFVKSCYQLRTAELLHFDTKAQVMYIPLGRRSYITNFRKSLFGLLLAEVSLRKYETFFCSKETLDGFKQPCSTIWLCVAPAME